MWMDKSEYIQRGDALYVQTIHTSLAGTHKRMADSCIKVNHNCPMWNVEYNHRLCAYIHEIVSTRKAIMIATEKGNGRLVNLRDNLLMRSKPIYLRKNECVVGVYNQDVPNIDQSMKKYEISLHWDDCKTIENVTLNSVMN